MDGFLPEELIYQILIRVDALSLLRFKIVCKHWRFLISDSKFKHAHLRYSNNKPDQVIFSWIHNMRLTFPYDDINCYSINMKENIMRPQEIQFPGEDQLRLRYSCNGLLLLQPQHRYHDNLIIYNPVTRARTDLPPASDYCPNLYLESCHEWALVHDTYSRKYKVFGIKSTVEYFVFTQGQTDWKYLHKLETPYGREFTDTDYSEVMCLENKLYWTATMGTGKSRGMCSIYSIDVTDDELMTSTGIPFKVNTFHRLSEVSGSLYITNIFGNGLETWVLKDRDKNLWSKCCRICYGAHLLINPYLGTFVVPRDIKDSTSFLDHIRFFLFDDDDRLTMYDVKNKEMTKIALKHKKGSIEGRHYFHINSLLSWE
ncbi:hypothetical protein AQUCO_02500290v1 [Aquilegia coerulea]|uniref:F-box domain-containing protein n=1 Tax=Aquilegia coerulea TaxID=218851 RepID=A0A2G5DAC2_AQUCA|nr:hypothetical protein AQUCO_02500290v1 [Aquilegia coerulea]